MHVTFPDLPGSPGAVLVSNPAGTARDGYMSLVGRETLPGHLLASPTALGTCWPPVQCLQCGGERGICCYSWVHLLCSVGRTGRMVSRSLIYELLSASTTLGLSWGGM